MSKYRLNGENISLLVSIIIAGLFAYFISNISVELLALGVVFQLFYIVLSQKQIQGNSIRVTERQYPKIYAIAKEYSSVLSIELPNIYINFDPYINAYVMGFKVPYTLVLTSALVESMTENELRYVIGHELGHIKFGHSKIKSLVMPLDKDIPFVTIFFNSWLRKTEYSADRVGLVLTGNINHAVDATLKITVGPTLSKEVSVDELEQHIKISFDEKTEKVGELFLDHPYVTNRIRALTEFYKSDILKNICKKCNSKKDTDSIYCTNCGEKS